MRVLGVGLLVWAVASGSLQAAEGALRVGTSGDYAPFSKDGAGFDVEVARRLARDLGVRVEWVSFRWPELAGAVERSEFDVAMSGVTWRVEREGPGWLTRSVARGGPCLLRAESSSSRRVGVNRGGFLEGWARGNFPPEALVPVDDNAALPELLARGELDAVVTDSFELPHFRRPGWSARCEPARERKVYWVSAARAADLGPRIDSWVAEHEQELRDLRVEYFGTESMLDDVDHLVDLLGRRLGLMPHVAAWKRKNGLAIEDPEREKVVLQAAETEAAGAGLDPASVRELFAVQIELAKLVQRRSPAPHTMLDLHRNLRPAISQLGERIVASLAEAAPIAPPADSSRFALLDGLLRPEEIGRLREALSGVRAAPRP